VTTRFPYLDDGAPPIARPIVAVRAFSGDRSARFTALLDTGSPGTVLDAEVARDLGIRLGRKGAEQARMRLLGETLPVQFEHVDLALIGSDETWTARVGFVMSDRLRMPFSGLLGSAGFFDRYVVTFAEYHGWVGVEHAANVPPV
jgi:hypothetical protein